MKISKGATLSISMETPKTLDLKGYQALKYTDLIQCEKVNSESFSICKDLLLSMIGLNEFVVIDNHGLTFDDINELGKVTPLSIDALLGIFPLHMAKKHR